MKRHFLFSMMAVLLLLGSGRMVAQTSNQTTPVELNGIWQMCFYVSGDPSIPGELKPSNSFKILTNDGQFVNLTVIPNQGAIIIGSGTYKQTAVNAFTEHVEKNLHLPQLVGKDNVLEYEMNGDIMLVKFFVKMDPDGNDFYSWYYETWKMVRMPAVYPKDLVR